MFLRRLPHCLLFLVFCCCTPIVLADDAQHASVALATAESLFGTKPSEAIMTNGRAGDVYLAGTAWRQDQPEPELRIWYRTPGGSLQEIWRDAFSEYTIAKLKFIPWKDDRSRSLAFVATRLGGNTLPPKRVYLYSLDRKRLFFIEYSPTGNIDVTKPAISITADTAGKDPEVESWLKRWAHELNIDGTNIDSDTLAGMEHEWLKANQRINNGPMQISFRAAIKGPTSSIGTSLEDGRYKWTSYFKDGVVGFDKQENRCFVLYVPNNEYEWIMELRLAGQYLYMKAANPDDSGHLWTVRIRRTTEANNEVFLLERGNYDTVVQPEMYGATTAKPAQPASDSTNSQQPSPFENRKILLFIVVACAGAGVWWAVQRSGRRVATRRGQKQPTAALPAAPAQKPRFCTACGAQLFGMERFCSKCGAAVSPLCQESLEVD